MSKKVVEEIILKAQQYSDFMKNLLSNPEKTLEGYSLTSKELEFFKESDEKTLRSLSPSCFRLSEKK